MTLKTEPLCVLAAGSCLDLLSEPRTHLRVSEPYSTPLKGQVPLDKPLYGKGCSSLRKSVGQSLNTWTGFMFNTTYSSCNEGQRTEYWNRRFNRRIFKWKYWWLCFLAHFHYWTAMLHYYTFDCAGLSSSQDTKSWSNKCRFYLLKVIFTVLML